jgi:hypothetical protein
VLSRQVDDREIIARHEGELRAYLLGLIDGLVQSTDRLLPGKGVGRASHPEHAQHLDAVQAALPPWFGGLAQCGEHLLRRVLGRDWLLVEQPH